MSPREARSGGCAECGRLDIGAWKYEKWDSASATVPPESSSACEWGLEPTGFICGGGGTTDEPYYLY